MQTYNKFMEKLWFIAAIALTIFVTVMCFREGFDRWVAYYIFPGIAFFYFFIRRYMHRRMLKHMQFLEKQKDSNN
jgi:Zn-dependent protease